MIRRIAAGAALMALLVCLSACACNRAATASTKSAAAPRAAVAAAPKRAEPVAARSGGGMAARGPADCSACYRSEADRDMGRLTDEAGRSADCSACGGTDGGHHHHDGR